MPAAICVTSASASKGISLGFFPRDNSLTQLLLLKSLVVLKFKNKSRLTDINNELEKRFHFKVRTS